MVALPKLTSEGYRILTYRLQIYNISHVIFSNGVKVSISSHTGNSDKTDCFAINTNYKINQLSHRHLKAFNMFNDMVLSRDGPINGYVVVFDMSGVCLRHLTLVQFGALRNFMSYIQVSLG